MASPLRLVLILLPLILQAVASWNALSHFGPGKDAATVARVASLLSSSDTLQRTDVPAPPLAVGTIFDAPPRATHSAVRPDVGIRVVQLLEDDIPSPGHDDGAGGTLAAPPGNTFADSLHSSMLLTLVTQHVRLQI